MATNEEILNQKVGDIKIINISIETNISIFRQIRLRMI